MPMMAGPMAFMTALFMGMMLVAALRLHAHFHAMLRESLRREAAERELAQMAWFDPLTELPNRRLFIDQLERAIAAARRQRLTVAVCCFDLDNFRAHAFNEAAQ